MNNIYTALQRETLAAINKLDPKCVDMASMRLGINHGEPLLLAMDGLLRYAKAHHARYEGKLSEDHTLGPEWLKAIKAIHALLNGDGAAAMEKGITTDSKSNGVLEEIYWAAIHAAGFEDSEPDLVPYRPYQPKTGEACHCKPGQQRDNCPDCEGTGQRIDFAKIRAAK